jgi:hypothetical protein
MLPGTIAGELLEPVPWWRPQIFERLGTIRQQELPKRWTLNVRRQPT